MADEDHLPTLPRYKTSDKYRVVKQIGKGSYGDVFLADRIEDGRHVCLKQLDLDFLSPSERAGCLSELSLLQSLPPHRHVVTCFDAFWSDTSECGGGSRLTIVLEYGDAGDLESFIQATYLDNEVLPTERALDIFAQIVSGLTFLHRQHVLHRDIKSKNVFRFSDGRVVIGDFGTCKSLAHTAALANTLVGSPLYMSPELLDDQPYSFSSDVWSLGCLLYELLAGRTPFIAASYPAVVFKITKGVYDPLPPSVPTEVQNVVARMLSLDPSHRPTPEELLGMEVIQAHLPVPETPHDAPGLPEAQAATTGTLLSAALEHATDVCRIEETFDISEDQKLLLPPPPPSATIITTLSEGLPAPPPAPKLVNAQQKARRDSSRVFPTSRASIADILSKERLIVHKERSRHSTTKSGEARFLSCVPVMETARSRAPPTRRATKPATTSAVATPHTSVPPENMLIIGTKVSSIKPTKR